MRRLLALVSLALFGLVVLSACTAAAAKSGSLEVGCDEFQKQGAPVSVKREATLNVGDTLTLTLCSNPTTGFSWEEAKIADAAVLEQVDRKSEEPKSDAMGAAGKEVWTFKALQKGKTNVSLAYSRPWAGGEKGVWQFELAVEVK